MTPNYDPMGQAMQMLQVLGQRRAQQQGNEISQQELALRAQQMAQQGDQFDRGFGLDQQRLAQQGSQFDRGQSFAEANQRYTQERNSRMDPLAMAQQIAQTQGMQINNQQAPEMLRIQQLNAALHASQLPMQREQMALQKQHYDVQDQYHDRMSQVNELEAMMRAFPPMPLQNGTYQFDPRLLIQLQKMFPMPDGQQAPGGPPPAAFDTPENQKLRR